MKRLFLLFCLSIICVSCYKEVDITTLKMTSSVATECNSATIIVKSNIQSIYLKYRVYVAQNVNMSQNVKVYDLVMNGGTGSYKCNITGLTDGKKYYYQVEGYSTISSKRESVSSFTTKPAVLPTILTKAVTNISSKIAQCGLTVESQGSSGLIEWGLCWSTSPYPSLSDSHFSTDFIEATYCVGYMTGLTPGTQYYVRAYATNGQGTSYGSQQTFTTATTSSTSYTITVFGNTYKMNLVEGGTFSMGGTSEQGADADDSELPVHSVTLSGFYMGEKEVTQPIWKCLMVLNNQIVTGNSKYPVHNITYLEVQTFIDRLNYYTGLNFRLPTEAEWEYAARGGNKSQGYKYAGGNSINEVAWYADNSSGGYPQPVGSKIANELGLYDMSGNVYEWCQDGDYNYSSSAQTNPVVQSGTYRMVRGGSTGDNEIDCRVSARAVALPGNRYSVVGFRLVLP